MCVVCAYFVSFFGCRVGPYEIYTKNTGDVNATMCRWRADSVDYDSIQAIVFDKQDNPALGKVFVTPFLPGLLACAARLSMAGALLSAPLVCDDDGILMCS